MLKRIFGNNTEPETADEEKQATMDRETLIGLLCDHPNVEEVCDYLKTEEDECFTVEVTVDTLEEISELDSYNGDQRALRFAKRWRDNVQCFIRISDIENQFKITLEQIASVELENEMVRDFAKHYRTDIEATFDPLGEKHEQPLLSIHPF